MTTTDVPPEWVRVWRQGFAPILPTRGLQALAEALRTDDQRISQGSTTTPPPLMSVRDWPVECGCPIAFIGAVVRGGFADETPTGKHTNPTAATVADAEEFFAAKCYQADELLGGPDACRWFLNFVDDTPRPEMLAALLAEVSRTLAERESVWLAS